MCRNGVLEDWLRALAVGSLALVACAAASEAAEWPSQARKARASDTAAATKCNVGGVAGVLAANGACVKLSGSVSARFTAGSLK